jgi:hypothetical protein
VRPLEFPKYEKKNHRAWINAMMRCCSDHPETTQSVRIGEDFRGYPKRYFLDPWPIPVKEKVYDALVKSLPSAIFNEIATSSAITFALGDVILRRLNDEYGWIVSCPLKRRHLKQQYEIIKCARQETIAAYYTRFSTLLERCIDNQVVIDDAAEYCSHFLCSIVSSCQFSDSVSNLLIDVAGGILMGSHRE